VIIKYLITPQTRRYSTL